MSIQQHHRYHHRHHHHYQASDSSELCNSQANAVEEEGSLRLRTYEIYREKGGYGLDNWLEAEQMIKNGN